MSTPNPHIRRTRTNSRPRTQMQWRKLLGPVPHSESSAELPRRTMTSHQARYVSRIPNVWYNRFRTFERAKEVRLVPRKKRSVPKTGAVWRLSAEEATLAAKPRYNGFACGHGAHGDAKYNRAKSKRTWEHRIEQEGASRGLLPFSADNAKTTPAWQAPLPRNGATEPRQARLGTSSSGSEPPCAASPYPRGNRAPNIPPTRRTERGFPLRP